MWGDLWGDPFLCLRPRAETDGERVHVRAVFGRGQVGLGTELADLQGPAAPRLDDAAPVEGLGDVGVPRLRAMGPSQRRAGARGDVLRRGGPRGGKPRPRDAGFVYLKGTSRRRGPGPPSLNGGWPSGRGRTGPGEATRRRQGRRGRPTARNGRV